MDFSSTGHPWIRMRSTIPLNNMYAKRELRTDDRVRDPVYPDSGAVAKYHPRRGKTPDRYASPILISVSST